MNDNIFQDLLKNIIKDNKLTFEHYKILKEINIIEYFDYIEKNIGYNHKFIHIYLILIEKYVENNEIIPEKLSKYLMYIFENIEEISKENIYINDFLFYRYDKILLSNDILILISKYNIEKINQYIKYRLIKNFLKDFKNNINLKNHIEFFKNIFKNIIKNNINIIKDTNIELFELINYFNFKFHEALYILYQLEKNGIQKTYYGTLSINLISNKINFDDFFEELKKLDSDILFDFLLKTYNSINYLGVENLNSKINDNILFFLSLIYQKKLFETNIQNQFLNFYLEKIKDKNIFQSDSFSILSINNLIKFIINNNINIFENENFLYLLYNFIFTNIGSYYSFQEYIKNNPNFINENIDHIYKNFNINYDNKNIQEFIITTIHISIKYSYNFNNLIKILNYIKIKKINAIKFDSILNIILEKIDNYKTFKNINYKNLEYIILKINSIYNKENGFYYQNFIYELSKKGGRFKYIIGKNKKVIFSNIMNKSKITEIKENIFNSRIIPLIIIHYIKYLLNI